MQRDDIERDLDRMMEKAIEAQRRRVYQIALEIDPRITAEDLWNPQDVPAIANDARWNYEDGILAGWLAAQMAVRARVRETR